MWLEGSNPKTPRAWARENIDISAIHTVQRQNKPPLPAATSGRSTRAMAYKLTVEKVTFLRILQMFGYLYARDNGENKSFRNHIRVELICGSVLCSQVNPCAWFASSRPATCITTTTTTTTTHMPPIYSRSLKMNVLSGSNPHCTREKEKHHIPIE